MRVLLTLQYFAVLLMKDNIYFVVHIMHNATVSTNIIYQLVVATSLFPYVIYPPKLISILSE